MQLRQRDEVALRVAVLQAAASPKVIAAEQGYHEAVAAGESFGGEDVQDLIRDAHARFCP